MPQIRRALISVSDKRGLIEFATALRALNVELISTGGTQKALAAAGIEVRSVSDVTGFPEILDGRVKTLHPHIHAALLAIPDNEHHRNQLREHAITPIDLVVVNLYPFEQTIAAGDVTVEQAIEQIDIGGPTMLRAAAKNFKYKAVVVNPDRYRAIVDEITKGNGVVAESTCFELAQEVFHHTARYDAAIAAFFEGVTTQESTLPESYSIAFKKEYDLRYGENPHQKAALYGNFDAHFTKLHGKELSYNNIVDIAAAAQLVVEFDEPTVAIIKHTNPCGVGSGVSLAEAYEKAFATDRTSAFGGIVAVNRPLDAAAAQKINEVFTEVLVAPGYIDNVLEHLKKKKDRRLIRMNANLRSVATRDIKSVPGALLVQEADTALLGKDALKVVTTRHPTDGEMRAMRFAWKVAKHVKSNAIVYALGDRTLGVGAGQMSRVDSARIASAKAAGAGLNVKGCAVASDAFFPFADGLLEAVKAGATAVIQPGGSVRDDEVIKAANEHNIAMVFTGMRHFRH